MDHTSQVETPSLIEARCYRVLNVIKAIWTSTSERAANLLANDLLFTCRDPNLPASILRL